jgi:hypothetical protein
MALTRSAIKRHKKQGGPEMSGDRHESRHALQHVRKVTHWRELHDPATGRLLACRPAGSPAGSFPHTPWWHCVLHDPYERINFWSHAVPGTLLLALAAPRWPSLAAAPRSPTCVPR